MRARHRLGEDRSQFAQVLEVGYALVLHFLDDGLDDAGHEQLLADPHHLMRPDDGCTRGRPRLCDWQCPESAEVSLSERDFLPIVGFSRRPDPVELLSIARLTGCSLIPTKSDGGLDRGAEMTVVAPRVRNTGFPDVNPV